MARLFPSGALCEIICNPRANFAKKPDFARSFYSNSRGKGAPRVRHRPSQAVSQYLYIMLNGTPLACSEINCIMLNGTVLACAIQLHYVKLKSISIIFDIMLKTGCNGWRFCYYITSNARGWTRRVPDVRGMRISRVCALCKMARYLQGKDHATLHNALHATCPALC